MLTLFVSFLPRTPIQNDVKEFWTLLNFIDPKSFGDSAEFLEQYGDMKSKERVDELHEEIRPYILRRLKEDVEKSVPPKEETLIEVELTVAQNLHLHSGLFLVFARKLIASLYRNRRAIQLEAKEELKSLGLRQFEGVLRHHHSKLSASR